MKKIFTLLAAMTATALAWADAPTLLFGDQPVEAGKTYETAYETEVMDLGTMVITLYKQDSNLFIKGDDTRKATVEVTASQELAVCSIDGSCVKGKEVTKEGFLTEQPKSLEIHNDLTDYEGVPAADLLSDITVKVKAYYNDAKTDAIEVTVVMTNKTEEELNGGVSDVAIDGGSVRLSNAKTLDYNLDQTARLEIYNAAGALVMSRKIKGTGSVALDSLHPGVYIYSAAGHTGKVLIRK